MRGKLTIISPDGVITYKDVAAPLLDDLQEAVEGSIETVPYWTRWHDRSTRQEFPCVAFCNEEGKLKGLEANLVATFLWQVNSPRGRATGDLLVGPVVIVTGDDEFLAAL